MKKRNVFLKLRRCDAYPLIKLHHRQTLQSMIPTKLWKVLRRRHSPVENKHLMPKHIIKNLTKTGTANQQNIARKEIKPKIINLSKQHLTKFQISLLTIGPKFCPTAKGNVFEIKSDNKEFTRKLKLRERFQGIEY